MPVPDELALERTLVILKPDAVARGLAGELLARFERKGLRFAALKLARLSEDLARRHYAEHAEKSFFPGLVAFITSGPVVVAAVEGLDAVAVVRKMIGATHGGRAEPGSIRGDYGLSRNRNLVHASDSAASAARELALFFAPGECLPVDPARLAWHYAWNADGQPE